MGLGDLRCAPPGCIVHHGEQGGPMSVRSEGHPRHFSFFDGSQRTCKKQTLDFLSVGCSKALLYTFVNKKTGQKIPRAAAMEKEVMCLHSDLL